MQFPTRGTNHVHDAVPSHNLAPIFWVNDDGKMITETNLAAPDRTRNQN